MRIKLLEDFFKKYKKLKIPTVILLLAVGIYALLHFFVFEEDPIQTFIWDLYNSYKLFIEGIADFYLWFSGSAISIKEHIVFYYGEPHGTIESGMLIKWTLFLFLIFWTTPAKSKTKLWYTSLLLICLLILLPIGVVWNANYSILDSRIYSGYKVGRGIPLIALVTLLIFWLKKHSIYFLRLLQNIPFLYEIYTTKKTSVFVLIYFALALKTIITGAFSFEGWVNLIFNVSEYFLDILGYEAKVSPFYLYGDNVLIFMNKSCLGFLTMLLFSAIVWLTGRNDKTTWLFILFGLFILNFLNVIRFILLYIYLNKHGAYLLSIDIHDIYTAGIYFAVILLWMLWFNKYSNLSRK